MEWSDSGMVLSSRRHGETSAIVDVFTANHGRHSGIVRGGASRKIKPALQPGNQVALTWRARLEDHLGVYTLEPVKDRAARLMSDRLALAGLGAATAMIRFALPEREPHENLYADTLALVDLMAQGADWTADYVRWEVAMLEDLGFGLDLTHCAATGSTQDLIYVSPKSGRAVSRKAGADWADRMLPLPPFLFLAGPVEGPTLGQGLRLTGYFLQHWLGRSLGQDTLPPARGRLLDMLVRKS